MALLENDRIRIQPLARDDIPQLLSFFSDMDSMKLYLPELWRTYNLEQLYGLLADWHDEANNFVYAVRRKDVTQELIGITNLSGIDWTSGTSEVGLAVVNPDLHQQGFGTEMLTLMLDYAFRQLGLRRIHAQIMAPNISSQKLFEKLGFQKEGILRAHVLRNNEYLDMLMYGLLRDEWPVLEY